MHFLVHQDDLSFVNYLERPSDAHLAAHQMLSPAESMLSASAALWLHLDNATVLPGQRLPDELAALDEAQHPLDEKILDFENIDLADVVSMVTKSVTTSCSSYEEMRRTEHVGDGANPNSFRRTRSSASETTGQGHVPAPTYLEFHAATSSDADAACADRSMRSSAASFSRR